MKSITKICDVIESGERVTLKQIVEATGKAPQLISSAISAHRNQPLLCESRRIRIVDWIRSGPRNCAVYSIGDGPDVAPAKSTDATSLENSFRALDLREIDVALQERLTQLRPYLGNPFGVCIAQCEVRA